MRATQQGYQGHLAPPDLVTGELWGLVLAGWEDQSALGVQG